MKKPILLVMAAGMGSRYGGLKQMDPMGAMAKSLWITACTMPHRRDLNVWCS